MYGIHNIHEYKYKLVKYLILGFRGLRKLFDFVHYHTVLLKNPLMLHKNKSFSSLDFTSDKLVMF